jgi:hypothetical protein
MQRSISGVHIHDLHFPMLNFKLGGTMFLQHYLRTCSTEFTPVRFPRKIVDLSNGPDA